MISLTPKIIIAITADALRIKMEDITGNTRLRPVPWARMIVSYCSMIYTDYSFTRIGEEMGKDHATVIYHIRQVRNMKHTHDELFLENLNAVEQIIKQNENKA